MKFFYPRTKMDGNNNVDDLEGGARVEYPGENLPRQTVPAARQPTATFDALYARAMEETNRGFRRPRPPGPAPPAPPAQQPRRGEEEEEEEEEETNRGFRRPRPLGSAPPAQQPRLGEEEEGEPAAEASAAAAAAAAADGAPSPPDMPSPPEAASSSAAVVSTSAPQVLIDYIKEFYTPLYTPLVNALYSAGCIYHDDITEPLLFDLNNFAWALNDPDSELKRLWDLFAIHDGPRLASLETHYIGRDLEPQVFMRVPNGDGQPVYNIKVTLFLYLAYILQSIARDLPEHINTVPYIFFIDEAAAPSTLPEIPPEVQEALVLFPEEDDDGGSPPRADVGLGRRFGPLPTEIRLSRDRMTVPLDTMMTLYCELVNSLIGARDDEGGLLVVSRKKSSGEGSGDVIEFVEGGKYQNQTFKLTPWRKATVGVATRYTESMEVSLVDMFPARGVKVCRNTEDDYCFAYTVIMGLIWLNRRNGAFTRGKISEPLHIITAKGLAGEAGPWVVEFTTQVLARTHPLLKYIQDHIGRAFTLREFYQVMKEMEDLTLTPLNGINPPDVVLDVYIVKPGHHVYPGYISKRPTGSGTHRIPLFAVYTDEIAHYGLVTRAQEFWAKLRGKQFFTCSVCKESFFSRTLLACHACRRPDDVDDDEYHWSGRWCSNAIDIPFGSCKQCHLKFPDEFSYEFHKENCLMKGRSGFKYIELPEERKLTGVAETRETLPEDHIYFADFECFIGAGSKHELMSYGLYGDSCGYIMGYSMDEFIHVLEEEAKQHKRIKVIFHNAMNYDATFILRFVLNHRPEWTVQVIMKSCNKLQKLAFTWKTGKETCSIDIGDSFLFFPMSLERICACMKKPTLEENVAAFPRFFVVFTSWYQVGATEASMILKKNLFPYRFFNEPSKLDTPMDEFAHIFEPREDNLPFFGESVTVDRLAENYPEFQNVVQTFQCADARAYHDLYLRCDVLELADIYSSMREILWETHHINIAEYMGTPSATWAAFLRSDPNLEIALYDEMYYPEFFHRMMRGGVTSAPLRYARSDDTHTIMYLDVNGLYPYVMQKYPYPCGDFRWRIVNETKGSPEINQRAMEALKVRLTAAGRGFCAMVDLEIPDELHNRTDQFPFAPEHRVLYEQYFESDGELYPFLKRWSEANPDTAMAHFKGLVGTLYPKKRYCLHGDVLLWYLRHGAHLTYVHNIVTFKQSYFLRPYIQRNIEMRNAATDEYRKMLLKLMNNSIYGKTCENPLNHSKYVIVRNKDALDGLIETSCVRSITPIDESNFIVQVTGEHIPLDKPTYVGACVTDFAKLHMYEIFYDKLGSLFEEVELVYTDTDSFIVRVKHEPGKTLRELLEYMNSKGEVLIGKEGGLLKSETGDDRIEEVIALRSKVYAYKTQHGKYGQRAKGTTATAQEQQLNWGVYKGVLETLVNKKTTNVMFAREHMEIRTCSMERCSLSPNDGKRYICEDGIHTHAFGYHGH